MSIREKRWWRVILNWAVLAGWVAAIVHGDGVMTIAFISLSIGLSIGDLLTTERH